MQGKGNFIQKDIETKYFPHRTILLRQCNALGPIRAYYGANAAFNLVAERIGTPRRIDGIPK
jgi:hypothetical protein